MTNDPHAAHRDEARAPATTRTSIVAAYCQEVGKLATTLADLLDVAASRADSFTAGDRDALLALGESIGRLASHVDRAAAAQDDTLPAPPTPAPVSAPTIAPASKSVYEQPFEPRPMPGISRTEITQAVSGMLEPERSRRGADYADFMNWVRRDFEACQSVDTTPMGAVPAPAEAPRPPKTVVPRERLLETLQEEIGHAARIQGTTDSIPMKAVFQLIEGGRKTGCLHLRTPTEHLQFMFDGGNVVAVSSDDPPRGLRLGDILVRLGHVDEATLSAFLTRIRATGVPLGEALSRESIVTVEQLAEALQNQLHEQFARMEREPNAAYGFVPATRSDHDGKLKVTPRELLLESARRSDEARRGT